MTNNQLIYIEMLHEIATLRRSIENMEEDLKDKLDETSRFSSSKLSGNELFQANKYFSKYRHK